MATDLEKAYLAGIIDGEGSIGVCQQKRGTRSAYVRLLVTGTDKNLLEWLMKNFDGNFYWKPKENENWKPEFIWRVSGKKAIIIIKEVLPFLVIKKKQASVALAIERIRGNSKTISLGYRKGWSYVPNTLRIIALLHSRMKALNRRGI